jgi:hypothetical protein
MKTSERIIDVANSMAKVFEDYPYASPEPAALARLKSLAQEMPRVCFYCRETAQKVVSLANDFYSERKHQRYPGGPSDIQREVDDLLDRIRDEADKWATQGD